MKYIFLFCFLAASANLSNAQIIFTSDEFLATFVQTTNQPNYLPVNLDGLQALIDKSGASQTWDFTGITWIKDTSSGSTTSTLLPYPGGAPFASDTDFAGSTHVMKDVSSTPGDPVIYEFFKINNTGFWILGESQDNAGVKSKLMSLKPPLQELQFPLSYKTAWTSSSNFNEPDLPGFLFTEKIDAIVDGYGTLVLPGLTTDCLRLKLKMTATVSGSVSFFSQYEFLWITSNGVTAVVDADSLGQATSESSANSPQPQPTMYKAQPQNEVYAPRELAAIRLSQNPAQSDTKLFYSMMQEGAARIILMDALGKEVHTLFNGRANAGQNIIPIDASKLSPGAYFIHISADGISATRKLIVTK